MYKYKYLFGLGLLLLIGYVVLFSNNTTIQTSISSMDSLEKLSNKKIEWGIKRGKNHEQPDLGITNKRIIDEANGIAIGSSESKKVYLTFDLGYEAGYMPKILDILKDNETTAAFFITAHYVNSSSDNVKRMIEEGHIVGNHTVNHKSMPLISLSEIKNEVMDLHVAIYNKFGYEMKYMRPPKGEYSEKTLNFCNTLGYKTVMWSFAYDDWEETKQGREEYGRKKIIENIHNGAVLLLHGTSKDNSNILDSCIKEIKAMGYVFASLDEFEK